MGHEKIAVCGIAATFPKVAMSEDSDGSVLSRSNEAASPAEKRSVPRAIPSFPKVSGVESVTTLPSMRASPSSESMFSAAVSLLKGIMTRSHFRSW